MTELKNCPNCGGILDDTGRCLYCKSKVYDLTDIKIDLNNREPIILKFMNGKEPFIIKCYMCDPQIMTENVNTEIYVDKNGVPHRPIPIIKHLVSLKFIEY